ncbi:helix-turn-helix domain-containing protein [Caulobacter sp. BP25]|uniref:helix-turn-helix domain-containing protein n=1 Tax=Caulobacter sp. BP25 TaxID=2048900 RepID=UPI003517DC1F
MDDRSRPNDWNIRPHAHADLNHVFLISEGAGVIRAEGETIAFAAPCLLLIPAGVVHGFVYEPDSAGSVLTIADSYLRELVAREPGFAGLFRAARQLPLPRDSRVSEVLARLGRELVWTAPGRGAAVEGQLLTLLVEALRLLVQAHSTGPAVQGAQARLVARYRELVEAHFREGRSLEFYAGRLGCTVSRLRTACLKTAGVAPLRLVHDRLLLEAKRALIYSNMTVAEVAYQLGFEDPAYFSRFFSKAEGCSPRQYRTERAFDETA